MKRLYTCLIICLACASVIGAQTPVVKPDLGVPTLVAPAYFGPNAFPVPDMLDGRTSGDLKVELYGDGFLCSMTSVPSDDITLDLFAKATIPLFSDRVNLVIWMPVVEWFRSGPAVNMQRRIQDPDRWISGIDSGDAYVSTDIMILDERKAGCGIVLRAALKSASGNSFGTARVYDAPGYFFDIAAGRDIRVSADGKTVFRMALSAGFLCWQTANGRQNDAVMYGALASLKTGPFNAELNYGGYVGWEGKGDRPMTLKTKLSWSFGRCSLNAMYQVGFMDWPFHQIRLGATYSFPLTQQK
jgi:hypothetical protein